MLQDALSEVTKKYPPLKLRVFVDDITALFMVKNKVVAEMAKKVMKRLREELSVKEKARSKKCKVRFSMIKKNEVSQKNYMNIGSRGRCQQGRGECMQWR